MPKIPPERVILLNEVVKKIAGKNTEAILPIMLGKKNVNEFKIADKLKLTINQTRNILYKLNAFGVVSFTRKKDKRKGWYIYFWTIDELKALHTLKTLKDKEIEELNNLLLIRQQKRFFVCIEDNIEVNEETAMHHEFICPECGKLLDLANNEKKIKEIQNRIESIRRENVKISVQIEILTPKPKPIIKKVKKKAKPKKKKAKKVKKKKGKTKKKVKKKNKPKKKKGKKAKGKKPAKKKTIKKKAKKKTKKKKGKKAKKKR